MPFLTLEDPNARLKGSRDPLGVQPIWASFARHVVQNLTTQSASYRDFTTFLLGRYFAEQLVAEGRVPAEHALDVFLRTEQVAAYVRHVRHGEGSGIRGIERVRRFRREYKRRVPIHTGRRGAILSDQKIYGLWGLYTVPARRSGLVPEHSVGLTDVARELVEREYLSRMWSARRAISRLLSRNGTLELHERNAVYSAFAEVLAPRPTAKERVFYGRYVRDAAVNDPDEQTPQRRLSALIERHTQLEQRISREEVSKLASRAGQRDPELVRYLERILRLEAVIAPAALLFDHVLQQTERTPEQVGKGVRELWGRKLPHVRRSSFDPLVAEVESVVGPSQCSCICRVHDAFVSGDYTEAVRGVLEWNAEVMSNRQGAPWARVSDRGKVDVRFRGSERGIPCKSELPQLWENSYFLDSLKALTRDLSL